MPEFTDERLATFARFNAREIMRDLPEGLGFALFVFPLGERETRSIVFTTNARPRSLAEAMAEWAAQQLAAAGPPTEE